MDYRKQQMANGLDVARGRRRPGAGRSRILILPIGLIVLAIAAAPAGGAARTDGPDAAGPLDLAKAKITQSGRSVRLLLRARGRWKLSQLTSKPPPRSKRPPPHLCVELRQGGKHSRSCFGVNGKGEPRLTRGKLAANGAVRGYSRVSGARIKRPDRRSVEAVLRPARIGLQTGRYRWRAISGWRGPACSAGEEAAREAPAESQIQRRRGGAKNACADRVPNRGFVIAKLRRPRVVGCSRDEDLVNRRGSSAGRRVALTFDDGPGQHTSQVMRILEVRGAKGTFYVLGLQIPGRSALLRRMVRDGHEIGNHSTSHGTSPSYSDIALTSDRIRAASGFTPCTFRPPFGILGGATQAAWSLGMSTIIWDVDTNDWQLPGAGAIYSRVVSSARAGSIVLMHDGGGNRGQTVAALPGIVDELQRRGFRLVTVSKLLGERMRYGP